MYTLCIPTQGGYTSYVHHCIYTPGRLPNHCYTRVWEKERLLTTVIPGFGRRRERLLTTVIPGCGKRRETINHCYSRVVPVIPSQGVIFPHLIFPVFKLFPGSWVGVSLSSLTFLTKVEDKTRLVVNNQQRSDGGEERTPLCAEVSNLR